MLIPGISRLLTLLCLWLIPLSVFAGEGLWPIDQIPVNLIHDQYGVSLSKDWIEHARDSAVRLSSSYGGCSASLVSKSGLVLTNNHCIAECAQDTSEKGTDRYTDGYLAANRGQEPKCEKLSAEIIDSITDVTKLVPVEAVGGSVGDRGPRNEAIARLQQKCSSGKDIRCDVVEFYRGGQYKLIRYRTYADVRLVFSAGAKEALLASGTDPSPNFDVAFLRIYDNGRALDTPTHLQWELAEPKAGDLTFLLGSPRISERQLTVSQLASQRDLLLPTEQLESAELIGLLTRFGTESEANKAASQYQLYDILNHFSYTLDLTSTLRDPVLFGRKVDEENAVIRQGGEAVKAAYRAVNEAEKARAAHWLQYRYVEQGPQSELFKFAKWMVRGAIERSKPEAARDGQYSAAMMAEREKEVMAVRAVYQPLEQLELEFWLRNAERYLHVDGATTSLLLKKKSPMSLAHDLAESKLGDVEFRRKLWSGGLAAVESSDDPMIRYVLSLEPDASRIRVDWERSVKAPEKDAMRIIAMAAATLGGPAVFPDANRTLRLSVGKIEGYVDNDRQIGPFSTFGALNGYVEEYGSSSIDRKWLDARKVLPARSVLTMITSNDGINGNSGSPILDSAGSLTGLFTGGNTAAMGGNYFYDPTRNRATAVAASGIIKALATVYSANALVEELVGPELRPALRKL